MHEVSAQQQIREQTNGSPGPTEFPSKPLSEQSTGDLWAGIILFQLFMALLVGGPIANELGRNPEKRHWSFLPICSAIAVGAWGASCIIAPPVFRELQARGRWVPNIAIKRPWLAMALLFVTLLAAVVTFLRVVSWLHG
jgi:hypothetical protein